MPCAGSTGEGHHLKQKETLPGGSPLAIWYIVQLVRSVKIECLADKASRGLVESAETCKKDPDGIFFGLAAEIKTRRYGLGEELFRALF